MGRLPEGDEFKESEGGGYKSTRNGRALKRVMPHHRAMARHVAVGTPPMQICMLTGFTPGQMSVIMGSPLFQAEVARITEDIEEGALANVQEELKGLGPRAVEVLAEDMERSPVTAQDAKIRQSAAMDILNRNGYKAPETGARSDRHIHFHGDAKEMSTPDLSNDVLNLINVD